MYLNKVVKMIVVGHATHDDLSRTTICSCEGRMTTGHGLDDSKPKSLIESRLHAEEICENTNFYKARMWSMQHVVTCIKAPLVSQL